MIRTNTRLMCSTETRSQLQHLYYICYIIKGRWCYICYILISISKKNDFCFIARKKEAPFPKSLLCPTSMLVLDTWKHAICSIGKHTFFIDNKTWTHNLKVSIASTFQYTTGYCQKKNLKEVLNRSFTHVLSIIHFTVVKCCVITNHIN